MKVGIVGFRGSGKTTVFNALTGLKAEVGGYHGDDVKNVGHIKVPDDRLRQLADRIKPKKVVFAEMLFADLAAATPSRGKGFSPQAMAEMRQADALVHVVRGFENPDLSDPADLVRDARAFESEISLADMIVVENRLERLKKQGDKGLERDRLELLMAHLEEERPLRTLDLAGDAWDGLAGFGFISRKSNLLLLNVPEEEAAAEIPEDIADFAELNRLHAMVVSGLVEMEINDFDEAEGLEYLESLGLAEPARERFVRRVYTMLELISFFTFTSDEVRAWTIRRGTNVHQAAGKIHTDMARGFIRAEVMQWRDVAESESEAKMREAGKIRLEGKDYIPADGEVIRIRFNV